MRIALIGSIITTDYKLWSSIKSNNLNEKYKFITKKGTILYVYSKSNNLIHPLRHCVEGSNK
jgi:hypothetical protein